MFSFYTSFFNVQRLYDKTKKKPNSFSFQENFRLLLWPHRLILQSSSHDYKLEELILEISCCGIILFKTMCLAFSDMLRRKVVYLRFLQSPSSIQVWPLPALNPIPPQPWILFLSIRSWWHISTFCPSLLHLLNLLLSLWCHFSQLPLASRVLVIIYSTVEAQKCHHFQAEK